MILKYQLEEENTVYNENSNIESTMVTLNLVKENYIDIERWDHLEKAICVMGWILRFLNNSSSISSNRKNGDLTLRSSIRLNLSYSALLGVRHSPVRQLPIQEGSRVPKGSHIAKLCAIGHCLSGFSILQRKLQSDVLGHPYTL